MAKSATPSASRKPNKTLAMNVDLLWQLERVGSPSLSPDGAQVVTSVTQYDMAKNKGSASLWLLNTFGGTPRRLTHAGEKDGQAAWSPKGDQIAFVAKREQGGIKDEAAQLYLIAPDGGEARRVSSVATGVDAFKWMPDGKSVVFVSWVWPLLKGHKAQAERLKAHKERKDTAYVTEEAQYRYWDHNIEQGRVPHLHLLNLKTGSVRNLFEASDFELSRMEPDAHCFDVSPDGKHLSFAFDPAPQKRGDNCTVLVEFNVAARTGRTVVAHKAWTYGAPRYSPNGDRIAMVAANLGKKHTMPDLLAVYNRATGQVGVASQAWDHAVGAPLRWESSAASAAMGASDGAVYFAAEDRGQTHLWRFDLAAAQASIAVHGGTVQGFDAGADSEGAVLVTLADAMKHPSRLSVTRPGQNSERLESFNDNLLAKVTMGAFESITYKGAKPDGKTADDTQMWVVYPPGFDAKKKYPLLHSIHGGPHAASGDTFHYRWNNQVFAAEGYVVVGVNYHGSSGFGHQFLDSITHRWGELELQDIEAATDLMLKKPYIDSNRVFATGGSYGGYMVAWMNSHVKAGRYKAYVCHAGCYDWVGMFSDDAWHWHAKELGGWYWDNMAKVLAQSPHNFAAHLKTPTLVIHGALDYRVPDAQGLAYYNTLKALNVPARLMWFPDENHWILKPANAKLWYGEYFDWLRRFDPAGTKARKQ